MRDGEGKPTGVFLDTAFEWVQSQLPQWSTEDRLKYYKAAMDKLTLSGITGVHDAAMTLENIEFLKKCGSFVSHGILPIQYETWQSRQQEILNVDPRFSVTDLTANACYPFEYTAWSRVQSSTSSAVIRLSGTTAITS